jgi:1-acyl-sn-glycerol-3-phosphate acyltransferase
MFDYRAYGSERVPSEGGFIIAPNHGCYFDSFFFLPDGGQRGLRCIAKQEVFRWPVFGRIARAYGGFPVRRGEGDTDALRIARAILEAGDGLIMFAEGTLTRAPGLGRARAGIAVLALQAGVPVVPVAAWGNKPAWVYGRKRRFWRRPRTTVVWGEPLHFARAEHPSRELIEHVRDRIWNEVGRLHELAHALHELPGGRPRSYDVPARAVDDEAAHGAPTVSS